MRNSRSLSGTWQFQLDPGGTATVETLAPDREIAVPLPWQAALPELRTYSGYAWYRRSIDLEDDWLEGELLLHLGAVDYWCQVFVNGTLAGQHEGGYTPLTLPVRSHLRPGRNEIAVRVYDTAQAHIDVPRWPDYAPAPASGYPALSEPPFDANHIPHGKQEWYINVGGIWQDVTLIAVPSTYIESVRITPDVHTGEARVTVELAGGRFDPDLSTIHASITGSAGESQVQSSKFKVEGGNGTLNFELSTLNSPRLWSLEDPYLYTAVVTLQTPGGEDRVEARFGFREISTGDGRLLLNGEPIFLLSALDQDLYPDTIYTVPSEEYLRDQFQKAKHLGLNCLRCHIKPPDPRYLDLADEMGLLVWAEIPSWRTFYPKGTVHPNQLNLDDAIKRRVEHTLEEMVRRDFNHPSLVIWTIVNEDWGTALPLSAADRAWVAEMYDRCKQLDPTRLVVDNSPCPAPWGPNIHVKSDLDDFHVYANIPDQARIFTQTIEQFSLRPLWTYSSHGEARRTGKEPLVLSEFGNWGLPSLDNLRAPDGADPAWFDIGAWWSPWDGEPGWPAGVVERFDRLGLGACWPDYEEFARATQWHQYAAMKYEIETMRRQPNLAGYVITELTDAYWESNGLLDFTRQPKVYHDLFASINSPDMIVPQTQQYAYWEGRRAHLRLHASHYGPADWTGARLRWSIGGTEQQGEVEVPHLERGEVRQLGRYSWSLPQVDRAAMVSLGLEIRKPDGQRLAQNALDVLVLPSAALRPAYQGQVAVIAPYSTAFEMTTGAPVAVAHLDVGAPADIDPDEPLAPGASVSRGRAGLDLAVTLRRLGYDVAEQITSDTRLAVTNHPNAGLLRWVREGGDLLFFTRGPSPFFWVQGRGGAYSGNWITSFSWIRPDVHRRLKAPNPLGLPFRHVMPNHTILGLPVEDPAVQGDFLAGMVAGWVRHPAVHTVQFRYGRGRVVMTTFAFDEALHEDPVSIALFHDLVDHLTSDACQPTLKANYEL
jgi:hypothetical protein